MLYWTKYLASLTHPFFCSLHTMSAPLSLSISMCLLSACFSSLCLTLWHPLPPPLTSLSHTHSLSLNWENLAYKPSLSSVLLYTCCLEWLPCYLLSTRDVGFLLDPIARSRSRMVKTDCRFTEGWSYFWNQSGNLILLSKSNEVAGMGLYKQGYL